MANEGGSMLDGRAVMIDRARRTRCDRLSGKERLVLVELARGNSTDEIGLVLSVSPHTVRTHVKNLMRKLGARTRAHAVAIALSESAIEINP
jgi:DNA-binding CsgD family transcriptional regulator